jgi:cytoskeleton protein RodZ
MVSTGSLLRELRDRRGVTLEELAQTTRIGREFLEALEADDVGKLPAGPFAKGFIRAYCQALNEAPDEALALHSARAEAMRRSYGTSAAPPREPLRRNRAPVLISLVLLLVLALALTAVTLTLKPRPDRRGERPLDGRRDAARLVPTVAEAQPLPAAMEESRPNAPPATAPVTTPVPPAMPIPRVPPVTARAAPAVLRPSGPAKSYRLVARASHATWIRVRLDGNRIVEEMIPAGARREWVSNRPFELRIANAGGVTLELDGKVLPPLGPRGTTVHRLVLPAGSR